MPDRRDNFGMPCNSLGLLAVGVSSSCFLETRSERKCLILLSGIDFGGEGRNRSPQASFLSKKCDIFQANRANSGTTRTSTVITPLLTFLLTVPRQGNRSGISWLANSYLLKGGIVHHSLFPSSPRPCRRGPLESQCASWLWSAQHHANASRP